MKKIMTAFIGAAALTFGALGDNAVAANNVAKSNDSAGVVTAQSIKSGQYKIDPYHTQVVFSVSHFGFTNYSGIFSDVSGSLQLNTKELDKTKLDIQIPVGTIQTTSPKLTEELKAADWLDVAQYPNARFVSTKIVKTGETTADVTGNLTLHGVTKPVTLHVTFIGAGVNPLNKAYTVGFQIYGNIQRSEFGIKTYLPKVGDEVSLNIAGAFEKKAK
ncbi:YceI family protein [Commensalibacter oyaizuii]|uniref:YceI family protein n=1 Tax=Commensalibacter oyaizuii TaxID=3043873 RepID=A0ABT6Q2W2_9PROT|nr:YceI family protein [Commensalibacter sp. TBRC 16381]MDI2091456.1 YceI family protein [Commensalibacter sp. TBRC 16381]